MCSPLCKRNAFFDAFWAGQKALFPYRTVT